ncbi:hypothetical protein CSOJ01_11061 [Colletotrichum sojae]|uniref:Uncharacterized protein n=1 Tax=Colletotrichum sojae TaxID=2175907 RepID=A0A8H6IZD8_9PEZI|nr:hypothetical protein CSOJ01_11061 [Colletotrichum sojae]
MPQRWRNGQVYNSLAPTPAAAYGGFRGSSEGSQHNATRIASGAATGSDPTCTDQCFHEPTCQRRCRRCAGGVDGHSDRGVPQNVYQEPVSGTSSWVAVTPSLRMAHFGQPSILRTLGATPTHRMRRLVSALYSSPERLLSPQPANEGAE